MTTEITEIDVDPEILSLPTIQKMYPSSIIRNELYLGNAQNALDGDTLQHLGVSHVVNVTMDTDNYFEDEGIEYIQFKIEDSPKEDISAYFERAIEFMDDALSHEGNKVFVHCQGLLYIADLC